MGQAALELSESQQDAASQPGAPDAGASADDLLSQIAGAEIDRLLAEADANNPAEAPAEPPTEPAVSVPAAARPTDDIDAVLTAATEPAPAPRPTPASVVAPAPVLEPAAVQPDERAALEATEQTIKTIEASGAADQAHHKPHIFLRPLEWMSVPLLACPEGVREVLGKLAIITLVNAIAVFVYVLIFRRH
jgi:hypothetical protein